MAETNKSPHFRQTVAIVGGITIMALVWFALGPWSIGYMALVAYGCVCLAGNPDSRAVAGAARAGVLLVPCVFSAGLITTITVHIIVMVVIGLIQSAVNKSN